MIRINDSDNLTYKNILKVSVGLLFLLLFGVFFFNNAKSYILGLLFGGFSSILNLRLLKTSTERTVKLPANKISRYVVSRYLLRYIIKALVLVIGFVSDDLNAFAVILGLLLVTLSIYLINFFNLIQKKLNKE